MTRKQSKKINKHEWSVNITLRAKVRQQKVMIRNLVRALGTKVGI